MEQYQSTLDVIKQLGVFKGDRTGTGTQSHFGMQRRYSLRNNSLPVVTTKKIHLASVIHELFWMLSGDTRVDYLISKGVRIWNEWVKPETAIYNPMSEEEILKAVTSHIGGKFVIYFHCNDGVLEPVIETRDEFIIDMTPEEIDAFWNDYPKIDRDEATHLVGINVREWNRVKTEGFTEVLNPDGIHLEYNTRLYRLLFNKEPQKLVGGDLGPVYGKTWRDIDDIRIVPKLDWVDFEARGFEFVVDIPGTDFNNDQCVVKRKIDQVQDVIDQLTNNPDSRRIIICAWDPRLVEDQALPPCHSFIQFWTRELTAEERLEQYTKMEDQRLQDLISTGVMERGGGVPSSVEVYRACMDLVRKERSTMEDYHADLDTKGVARRALSCQLYARSQDTFLGTPFNITFYSLMTHMLANQLNMVADEFIWTGGDCHVYSNHQEQTDLQLKRTPYDAPTVQFKTESKGKDIRNITIDDFEILNYQSHPHIAGKVAV